MRVCYIENEDVNINYSGGIGTYLHNLLNYCKQNQIDYTYYATGILNTNAFNFISLSEKTAKNNKTFFTLLLQSPKIKTINKQDIVHVQRIEMCIPIKLRTRAKVVCTLHGGQDKAVLRKKGIIQAIIYFFVQTIGFCLADYLIAVDDKNKERYCKYYPWIKKKMRTIPIGVDIEKIKGITISLNVLKNRNIPITGYKKIVVVCRMEPEKNLFFLLDVFKRMNENNKKIFFLMIGSGSLELSLKKKADDLALSNVFFLGDVINEEVIDILKQSDVLALASLFEGSPTVVKEALIAGIPIVSTDVGDVKDVLSKVDNGGFIAKNELDDFAEKLEYALKIDKQTIRFNMEKFGLNLMAKSTLEIYNQL